MTVTILRVDAHPDAVEEAAALSQAWERATLGYDDMSREAGPWLQALGHGVGSQAFVFVAVAGGPGGALPDPLAPEATLPGPVVGYAAGRLPLVDNVQQISDTLIVVDAGCRRQGVGTRLLASVERLAAERDRTVVAGFLPSLSGDPASPDALRSRTDPLVGAPSAGSAFALRHGFTVTQIERHSILALPWPGSSAPAAEGYTVEAWQGTTSEHLLDAVATLYRDFSSLQPLGDSSWGPEAWDADRVRSVELARQITNDRIMAVARHPASGELVGLTQLSRSRTRPQSCEQGITVVLPPHRGHGLGLTLKQHALALAARVWPEARRLHTWNAGENDHMWAINEQLGFASDGVDVCLELSLPIRPDAAG